MFQKKVALINTNILFSHRPSRQEFPFYSYQVRSKLV